MSRILNLSALSLLVISASAWSHGYAGSDTQPNALNSRGLLCKMGKNSNCGSVQWEPQSIEAPKGFPQSGPADGKIASAGHITFSALDEQSSTRWFKNPIKAGKQAFYWTFTAPHPATKFHYYITRQDWNPNSPLTRASFDLTPFCTIPYNNQRPPTTISHECDVPERSGYQTILAVWDVADTANAFYSVIDVDFGTGSGESGQQSWASVGTILPTVDLNKGDSVKLRVFTAAGERPEQAVQYAITSKEDGAKETWSHHLAEKINASGQQIKAGQKSGEAFTAIYGANPVYALASSGIIRTETQIDKAPIENSSFTLSGIQPSYKIVAGSVLNLSFTTAITGLPLDIEATVFDKDNKQVAYTSDRIEFGSKTLNVAIKNVQAGQYSLVVVGKNSNGDVLQKTQSIVTETEATTDPVNGKYDAVFPDKLTTYKAGTRVLQPKTGKVYECKPFPYSGYCVQWKASATGFEPGVGDAWQQAWSQVN
jgi:Uncharacterized protein conserved in bacteria